MTGLLAKTTAYALDAESMRCLQAVGLSAAYEFSFDNLVSVAFPVLGDSRGQCPPLQVVLVSPIELVPLRISYRGGAGRVSFRADAQERALLSEAIETGSIVLRVNLG